MQRELQLENTCISAFWFRTEDTKNRVVINSQLHVCVASSLLSENSVENYEVLGVKADRQETEDRVSFL